MSRIKVSRFKVAYKNRLKCNSNFYKLSRDSNFLKLLSNNNLSIRWFYFYFYFAQLKLFLRKNIFHRSLPLNYSFKNRISIYPYSLFFTSTEKWNNSQCHRCREGNTSRDQKTNIEKFLHIYLFDIDSCNLVDWIHAT